jgi:hypothetical protein
MGSVRAKVSMLLSPSTASTLSAYHEDPAARGPWMLRKSFGLGRKDGDRQKTKALGVR